MKKSNARRKRYSLREIESLPFESKANISSAFRSFWGEHIRPLVQIGKRNSKNNKALMQATHASVQADFQSAQQETTARL